MLEQATISVIIITKNEAANIEACLKSVSFADEIIIVDSGSEDDTIKIAKNFTGKIFVTDWPGYGAQKQRALTLATKEWVLSLDADERVTESLQQEIKHAIQDASVDAFKVRFQSEYCGKIIKFGDWRNEAQPVLFRRDKGRFVSLLVHERIEIQGKIGNLKNPIHHLAYRNLSMVLRKIDEYSSMGAKQKQFNGETGGLGKAIFHGLWAFIRAYVFRLGFLDGKEGFMLAVSNAEENYYRYLKLMYLNKAIQSEMGFTKELHKIGSL